jgi:PPK2 family polyphosphate:nucleotide phosphotransferase
MFAAKADSLLVPFQGRFNARKVPTEPPASDNRDWKERLQEQVKDLGDTQYRLFADGRYSVLIVLQALDAAGKDSTIRHVFAGVNPNGLRVASFKQPSAVELAHDFLWRTTAQLPERGSIAIFNRSYYEEVLVVRVHPKYLDAQHLPETPSKAFWADRLRAIADHEQYLAEQGTVILKFWLNVSKAEQRKRLLERIDEPDKNWKFNPRDIDERERWDDYIDAYQEALRATSRPWAPWYAIPADNKHYARWQVARLINDGLAQLDLEFPRPDLQVRKQAKQRLLAQKD